jgi:hypothetical protein
MRACSHADEPWGERVAKLLDLAGTEVLIGQRLDLA